MRTRLLPPRLDPVQIRCVLGLKDKLPARVKQAEQQNIRRAVGAEVVSYRIDPLNRGIDPGFDLAQEVDPVGCGAAIVGMRQGRTAGRLERPEDIAATSSAIVDLLFSPLGLGRCRRDELLAWKAPGRPISSRQTTTLPAGGAV
jgi:hypothetical protein